MDKQPRTGRTRQPRRFRPVVGPQLAKLLALVFVLFGLLSVNSLYLASVTLAEQFSGELYQDYFYQLMFFLHLLVGLVIILPALIFGALHLRNAWPRPNYRAKRAGLALYTTVVLLLASGLVLTRFDFFAVKDPEIRSVAYWLHVITPLIVVWLFILHRLAGRNIHYRPGVVWAVIAVALVGLTLFPKIAEKQSAAAAASHARDRAQ